MPQLNLVRGALLATALVPVSAPAFSASMLDVSGFLPGVFNGVAVTPQGTIESSSGQIFFGGADGRPGSFCGYVGSCEASLDIDFNDLIADLTFVVGGYNPGDFIEVFAYDALDNPLGSVTKAADGLVDLSAFAPISRIFIDDSSTGAGYGYDEFSWRVVGAQVPVPAAFPLLAGALGALAVWRRRR